MDRQDIFIKSGTNYKEITKELLTVCDLAEQIGNPGKKIGIKPNLVAPVTADYGGTTHPEVVSGIVEYLQEHGFWNLSILEGSWVGDRTGEAFEVCGFTELSELYQIPLIDMQKEKSVSVQCEDLEIRICSAVQELDFLINVPVLKGHCQTKMTCALKNMKGLIPNPEKRRFHALGLYKPVAYLNKVIRQDFIVVDNICGDLDFEDGGNPCVMNRVLAGRDPVLVDAWLCHEMHYEPEEIPYIPMAASLGAGDDDYTHAKIRYLDPDAKRPIPQSRKIVELKDFVEEVESCSACYGYLIPALEQLRSEGILGDENDSTSRRIGKICIGQGYRGKTGELGIGSCTGNFRCHLEGCPPTENQMYEFLKNYLSKEGEQK